MDGQIDRQTIQTVDQTGCHTADGLIFVGYQFSWISWRHLHRSTNSSTQESAIFCMNYEGKYYGNEF